MRVAKAPDGAPVRGTSLTNVVALGARFGDTLLVSASGPQADEASRRWRSWPTRGSATGSRRRRPPPRPPSASAAPVRAAPRRPPSDGRSASRPAPAPARCSAGVPASAGVATAPAHHLRGAFGRRRTATPGDDPADERARLTDAHRRRARTAIERDRDTVAARAGKAEAAIFDAHLALLDDEALLEPAQRRDRRRRHRRARLLRRRAQVADRYRALDEPLLRERATDVLDVGRRVVGALTGEPRHRDRR